MSAQTTKDNLLTLISDYADFNSRPVEVRQAPTAVEFSAQVSKGYPRIYHAYNAAAENVSLNSLPACPAIKFNRQDWLDLLPEPVAIAVTPNGRADDLHKISGQEELVFLTPASVQMPLAALFDHITTSATTQKHGDDEQTVFYLQSQNNNLTTDPSLAPLLDGESIPSNFDFAREVLGQPEAVNIWIGDERSVTSLHRDPYENLYLVLKGSKTFTLYPPVDEIVLPTRFVRTGSYTFDAANQAFDIQLDKSGDDEQQQQQPKIPWITISPLTPRREIEKLHPLYAHASPRTLTINEGEILYLPSGWFHHVTQRCGKWEDGSVAPCIAVNWWYDMDYDGERYVMRELQRRLIEQMKKEN